MDIITEDIFLVFFKKHHPHKLKYEPKVVEIIGNNVVIEMKNHKGRFCVTVNNKLNSKII